ncbi:Eae-like protein [Salmonella enterica]|nr:Eae-like protein [Salmonella enterica]EBL2636285.1 Eae-like protein [Salmonella enterica]EBM5908091.1 Eae-like protein [Salmonella enterica]EDZ2487146.1 Eae-like protein [Salmonella enterica]EEG6787903.1 Eae-like protein [Salmonella enterica]
MKEVKIYTIVSDQLSPPITGESFCTDMVRHSDYAELEDKYAALAADNDKAMESLKQADAVVKLAHEKFSALASENAALKKSEVEFNEYCRRECEDVGDTWVDDFTETPATDEFLAEVRASELDSLAGVAETMLVKFSNQLCSSDMHEVVGWKMVLQQATNRAAQLRKGVQS